MPWDQDLWNQCHSCGQAVPIYEANKESKLQDFVQPSTNPFNEGKSITGLDNKVKINTISEGKTEKDRIEQGKDEDIKRGLGKGYVVQVIQNGLNLLDWLVINWEKNIKKYF